MENKIKTVKLNYDNSKKIIIVLSAVIVILMAAVIALVLQKNPIKAEPENGTEKQTVIENTAIQPNENEENETDDKTDDPQALRHKVTENESSSSGSAVVSDNVKTVYLTFDDGPSPYTLQILDILDKYNVKATFFVINSDYNEYMKEIVKRGHTIALHSYTHKYSKIYSSQEAYYNDLQSISDVVYNETGVRTKIMRFPGGGSNTVSATYCKGIMSAITDGVQEKGYCYFDWNVSSGDADGNNVAVEKLVSRCKELPSSNTVIVLMHDTTAKKTTVEALPTIIENYQAMGCKFDCIKTSTPAVHHNVNN